MSMETANLYSLLQGERRKRPTILIYFMPHGDQPDTPEFRKAQAIADALIKTWEDACFPLAFVGGGWTWSGAPRRPRPGDLFFATEAPSLLRDRNFRSLDEDLGVPELLLAGGTFEEKIVPTVVDAYLDGRPVSVASDTLFFRSRSRQRESERAILCTILSSYARLLDAAEISNAKR
jgi:hypothetical protein